MKGYAYTDLERYRHNLVLTDQAELSGNLPPAQNNHVRALMMSRLDFDIKILEIPPIPDRDIHSMLQFKLRGIYPGDPQDTVFDYKVVHTQNKHKAILFITKKSTLEKYKEISGKKALILPLSILKTIIAKFKGAEVSVFFWHKDWVEILFLEQGELISSSVIKRARLLKTDFNKIARLLPEEKHNAVILNICPEKEKELILQNINRFFPEAAESHTYLFKNLFSRRIRKAEVLFSPRKKAELPPLKTRISIYVFILFIFGALLFNKYAVSVFSYRDYLNNKIAEINSQSLNIDKLLKEKIEFEDIVLMLREKRPVNIYNLLSELSLVFGKETEIISFSIKGNAFQIEGVGRNALASEESLKRHKSFKEINIFDIRPIPDSTIEKFRMTGVYDAQ